MRLDRKLFWSYIVIILIAIMTSFTLFTVASNQFLSYRLVDSMEKEMKTIEQSLQSNEFQNKLIGGWVRNSLGRLVQSNIIVIQNNTGIYMSSNEATEDILSNIDNDAYLERKYLMVSSQVDVGQDHYDILLLSEKEYDYGVKSD